MKTVFVLHIETESSENYYRVFENKPTKEQILEAQKEIYIAEWDEEPTKEYFTYLVGVRACKEVEVK